MKETTVNCPTTFGSSTALRWEIRGFELSFQPSDMLIRKLRDIYHFLGISIRPNGLELAVPMENDWDNAKGEYCNFRSNTEVWEKLTTFLRDTEDRVVEVLRIRAAWALVDHEQSDEAAF